MRCLYRGQVDDDDDVQCFWSWGHVYIYFWGLKSEVYIPNILDGHHQRDCIWIQQTVKQIDLIKSNLSENLLYHTIQLTIPDWLGSDLTHGGNAQTNHKTLAPSENNLHSDSHSSSMTTTISSSSSTTTTLPRFLAYQRSRENHHHVQRNSDLWITPLGNDKPGT